MQNRNVVFNRSLLAVAVALTFAAGVALADDVKDLSDPNTRSASVSVEDLTAVNPLYRYYSGINSPGVYATFGVDLVNRDAEGYWLKFYGRDLGKAGIQEAGASYEKQGDWRIAVDYNEITKYAPYEIQTKVGGIDSGSVTLNSDFRSFNGLGPDASLKLERTSTSVSASKFLSNNWKFNFSFKGEDKTGAILSAAEGDTRSGLTPANAGVPVAGKNYATEYFAPQPENYKHAQVSASVDYYTKKFQISGGYYSSFFTNNHNALNVTPGTDPSATVAYAAVQVPWISLPPSNDLQQLYVQGAYNFSDATHASFKVTRARLSQDDNFISPTTVTGLNPSGVVYAPGITNTNLGAIVDSTTAAAKVTSRLTRDLDLLASWRYDGRDDRTTVRPYVISGGTAYTNGPYSPTTNHGKLELSYRLPDNYRLSGAYDYNQKKMPETAAIATAEPGLAWRESITENTFHLDLRKSMSETVNGTATVAHGVRTGSAWVQPPAGTTGVTFPTATYVAAPTNFSDRTRDSVKLMLDWNPLARLSLQAYGQYARDRYTSSPEGPPTAGYALVGPLGLQTDNNVLYGLDAAFAITNHWKATLYYSGTLNGTNQNEMQTPRPSGVQSCNGTGKVVSGTITGNNYTCVPWGADLDIQGQVFGAGLNGAVGQWDLGAKYLYSRDRTSYGINYTDPGQLSPVPAGAGALPDSIYRISQLRLSGTYAYSKLTKIRLDYIYDLRDLDDYAWSNWTFSDGTRVLSPSNQKTEAVGLTVTTSF